MNDAEIQRKLSGKYADLYPIYRQLRSQSLSISDDIRIYLKTIYFVISCPRGRLAAVFWTNNGLEVALPIDEEHERLLNAKDLHYSGMNKKIILRKVDDVDEFVLEMLKKAYNNVLKA